MGQMTNSCRVDQWGADSTSEVKRVPKLLSDEVTHRRREQFGPHWAPAENNDTAGQVGNIGWGRMVEEGEFQVFGIRLAWLLLN